jgi:hypothetical protein
MSTFIVLRSAICTNGRRQLQQSAPPSLPGHGERYPIAARIVNTKTGGEFILIPKSITQSPAGLEVLKRLQIDITSDSAGKRP